MADDFLTTYAPLANDISGQTGLNPATVLGIIDTETGHGQHVLGNNIFGISPSGPRGQYVATYPDVQTASQAFVSLMQTPRYAPAATVTDPAVQAQLLVKGGYNTANPKYASVVAANAQNAVKQLGYQDGSGGPQNGASVNVTSSQPAPDYSGQPAAPAATTPAPDYNTPAPTAPAQPPASAPAPAPPTGATKGAAESDADFLQRSGAAVSGAKQGDPDADFLARTGAAPQGTPAEKPQDVVIDPTTGAPMMTAPSPPVSLPSAPDVDATIRNALQPAPNTTYGTVLPLARDETTGELRLALPSALRNPLLGLTGGIGNQVTFNPKTGTLGVTPEAASVVPFVAGLGGRDIQFSAPHPLTPAVVATTTGAAEAPNALNSPGQATADAGVSVAQADLEARMRSSAETLRQAREARGAPTDEAPAAPQPAAAGAEATTAPIPEKTPAQAQRDLETSVAQTATDRTGPQMQDHTVYVPGVQRTLAEREFSPQNSLDEKAAIGSDTAFRQQIEKIKRDNNETMVDVLRNDAGDKIALDDAYTARESVTPPSLQLFRDEVPVDAAPIVQQIDDILAGPSGKRGAVASTLQNVRSKLYDSDGNLETMPSQLYGARQNITDLLKKGARAATEQGADAQAAKAQLESLLEPFDGIINQGAPRYQQYLSDFRDASKPINQMEYLQQFQPSGARNVASAGGNLTFNKVNNMLSQITRDRAARGVNKAKSLTDDQINHVIAVRNELAAVDLKERLAAVRGSDTFQQLQRAGQTGAGPVGTALRGVAGMGAEGLAHALIATPTAGVGNLLLAGGSAAYRFGIKPAMKAAGEKRAAQKLADAMAARKAALLETQPAAGGPP